jgi:uncharacterized membrane protein
VTEEHHGPDFASVAHARMDALEARQELASVIDQLAAKADVKARLGRQLRTHKRELAVAGAVAGAVVGAIIGLLLWRNARH